MVSSNHITFFELTGFDLCIGVFIIAYANFIVLHQRFGCYIHEFLN